MLNPSTADDKQDDPIIRRCIFFAKKFGYGSLYVTNLFAYRATDKSEIRQVPNPIGSENDEHILRLAHKCDKNITAWGNDGSFGDRSKQIKNMLTKNSFELFGLKITKNNEPAHPLYLPNDSKLTKLS